MRRIGLGDLAEVFVATQGQDQDQDRPGTRLSLVAIKRISREMSSYDEIFQLFAREGELAARFHHRNVVEVFETGEVGGRPYIAMEYIPGGDVAHLIERAAPARLDPGCAVRIVLDMCAALTYVHDFTDDARALDVVHGDVTPTNILVSTGGIAKLIDFSVASSGDRDPSDNTVRGTYAYMSPEQVRGEPIDRRTDIFALGVVLWELISGRRLFRRQANYLTLAAVVEDPAPRLADLPSAGREGGREGGRDGSSGGGDAVITGPAAEALDEILARALDKDRAGRYGEVAELGRALEAAAGEFGWDLRPWTLQTMTRSLLSS